MKKTIFYVTVALTVIMIVTEVNALAILPYLVALFFMYQDLFQKIKREVPISVISILMLLLNLLLGLTEDAGAFIDVIVWAAIIFSFGQKDEKKKSKK